MDTVDHVSAFIHAMKTRRNLSSRTLKAYESDLRGFERFLDGIAMQDVGTGDIQRLVTHLESGGLCASSIRRKLASVKVFFGYLQTEGIIQRAPMWTTRERYRIPKQLPKVISRQEVVKILSVAHSRFANSQQGSESARFGAMRNMLAVELLFSLGLRIDELTGLNVDDVDPVSGNVVVHGKGRKERLLYLSSTEVRKLIERYLPYRAAVAIDAQALFVNRAGRRLGNGSVGRVFASLCDEAGIQRHYTPHCLRHTMATMLIENGADVRSVQEILGHSSISTTEIYIHVSRKRKRDVLGRFNERNNMRF